MHANDDRIPEFALMSKGLGSNYLTPQMIRYHQADPVERVHCTLPGGEKLSMPRYYKDKIFTSEQRGQIKAHWSAEMQKKADELYNSLPNVIRNYIQAKQAAFDRMHANYYQKK